jgi:hypothetical protein
MDVQDTELFALRGAREINLGAPYNHRDSPGVDVVSGDPSGTCRITATHVGIKTAIWLAIAPWTLVSKKRF